MQALPTILHPAFSPIFYHEPICMTTHDQQLRSVKGYYINVPTEFHEEYDYLVYWLYDNLSAAVKFFDNDQALDETLEEWAETIKYQCTNLRNFLIKVGVFKWKCQDILFDTNSTSKPVTTQNKYMEYIQTTIVDSLIHCILSDVKEDLMFMTITRSLINKDVNSFVAKFFAIQIETFYTKTLTEFLNELS